MIIFCVILFYLKWYFLFEVILNKLLIDDRKKVSEDKELIVGRIINKINNYFNYINKINYHFNKINNYFNYFNKINNYQKISLIH